MYEFHPLELYYHFLLYIIKLKKANSVWIIACSRNCAFQIHEEIPENVLTKNQVSENAADNMSRWYPDEITLLVKATALYPVGTTKRLKFALVFVSNLVFYS